MNTERGRLFIAVIPPVEVLDLIAALPRPDLPGVRWTRRGQWHITLRFLGDAEIAATVDALALLDAAPTEAVVGPAVVRLGRHVVCAPVAGLDDLAGAVMAVTADIGRPPDTRPFSGHMTLARLKRGPVPDLVGADLAATFPVERVHLVRSETLPDGARYEVIQDRQLGGPASS